MRRSLSLKSPVAFRLWVFVLAVLTVLPALASTTGVDTQSIDQKTVQASAVPATDTAVMADSHCNGEIFCQAPCAAGCVALVNMQKPLPVTVTARQRPDGQPGHPAPPHDHELIRPPRVSRI